MSLNQPLISSDSAGLGSFVTCGVTVRRMLAGAQSWGPCSVQWHLRIVKAVTAPTVHYPTLVLTFDREMFIETLSQVEQLKLREPELEPLRLGRLAGSGPWRNER